MIRLDTCQLRIYPGSDVPGRVLENNRLWRHLGGDNLDWSALNPDTLVIGTSTAIECIDETIVFNVGPYLVQNHQWRSGAHI